MFRRPLNKLELTLGGDVITPLAGLTNYIVAILAVALCFAIPVGYKPSSDSRLLEWSVAGKIPWGVVLLLGGGMSLVQAI